MRLKDTIEFIGLWEILNNMNFTRVEFDAVKNESGKNYFVMTPILYFKAAPHLKASATGSLTKRYFDEIGS